MEKVSIEFLGHAGVRISNGCKELICDPWLSAKGAYNGSWFQYPKYPKQVTFEETDAVYISHEHQDHFDRNTLSDCPSQTPVLTGKFNKKRLRREIKDMGFENVCELDNFEGYSVGENLKVKVNRPTFRCPPHWFDSAALIEVGDVTIFNMNDCGQAFDFGPLRNSTIDIFMAQASPAIWFPLVYQNYSDSKRRKLKRNRRQSAIKAFCSVVERVQPRYAIPFAGPPIFYDPEISDYFLEEESMFNTPEAAARRARQQVSAEVRVPYPGDVFEIDRNGGLQAHRHPEYRDFSYEENRREYYQANVDEHIEIIEKVRASLPTPTDSFGERFVQQMSSVVESSPYFRSQIDMRVLFDLVGPQSGKWIVDLREGENEEVVHEYQGEDYEYYFKVSTPQVEQVLAGEASWEDIFLSLKFEANRDPDEYNAHLFALLKMFDVGVLRKISKDERELRKQKGNQETTVIEWEGSEYEIQRFCPHAGGDLKFGDVEDGKVVCPNHHWKFDIKTGECKKRDAEIITREC